MAKSNAALHKFMLFSGGPKTLVGVLLAVTPGKFVSIRHRREGSSKWEEHIIAWTKIIALEGTVGDKEGKVIYNEDRLRVRRTLKGSMEFDDKMGMIKINGQEGEEIYVRAENLLSETIEGVDAPDSDAKKAAKKKKAAK